ncbi:MAG: DUF2155 domain-containing protein [Nitrospirae bacterium]|nr:DUF2155 domain-containing protein [Nitrospirota bacterium]
MKRVVNVIVIMLAIAGLIAGCKKAEKQPEQQTSPHAMQQIPAAPIQSPMPQGNPQMQPQAPMPPHGDSAAMAPKVEKKVVLPDTVKGKWGKVVLTVDDKGSNKTSEYKIKLNSDFKVPNSDIKVVVGDFLPDFKMTDTTITSGSSEPDNAAVHVEIFEGGKSLFKGWLFSKFPTMHPFEHPKYAIKLKEGIKS